MATLKVRLRAPRGSDLNFLLKAWLRGLGDTRSRYDKAHGYWDAQKEVISRTLEFAKVVVACGVDPCDCHPSGPDDHIVGYGVGELEGAEAVVHWLYVREGDRRKGVAKQLLARLRTGAGVDMTITACTRDWIRALAEKYDWRVSEYAPLYRTIEQLRKAG